MTTFRRFIVALQSNEIVVLNALAVVLGIASGAGIWLFKWMIKVVQTGLYGNGTSLLDTPASWTRALLPAAGGLLVGLIVHFFVGEERHHGVAGIMEAVALAGGRLRYRRLPFKATAAAIGIGSGASVGPEDPSVQIGANLGSMAGSLFHLSDERVRALVAAGAAAGIAAAFNAPIAGVFFALEIILGEISGSAFSVVVIASVASAVFTQAISGPQPAFAVPPYAYQGVYELPFYLVLGLLSGPVAALYIWCLYAFRDLMHAWRVPAWSKPVAGGLVVGVVGLFLPGVLGVGYESIERILNGESLVIGLLLALLAAKLVLTSLSIGSGFMGGVFAPSLFLGATLGAAFGLLADRLVPALALNPAAFAMVGMAAVLAGAVHAPLTAIILLFEMTNDYHIILPLMFAVIISWLVAQLIQKDSIYTLGLARKGVRLDRGRDVEVLQAINVEEVMHAQPATLLDTDSLEEAARVFQNTHHHGLPVLNTTGELVGILTLQDLERTQLEAGEDEQTGGRLVGEICTRELEVTYPDETIGEALRVMSRLDVGRLPVVARNRPNRLLGMLRRADVVRAYDVALTRRTALRHQAHQVRLGVFSPEAMRVIEIAIESGSVCAGQPVKEIPWPKDCVIASVRHGRQVLIPHGDTLLRAGDILVAVVEADADQALRELCTRNHPP